MKNQPNGATKTKNLNRNHRSGTKQKKTINNSKNKRFFVSKFVYSLSKNVKYFISNNLSRILKKPIFLSYFLFLFAISIIFLKSAKWLSQEESRILPNAIHVAGGASSVNQKVNQAAEILLNKGKKLKWSRSKFLEELEHDLKMIEAVDYASMRLGFDKQLRIQIQSQTPAYVLQLKDKSRRLVGHRARIMKSKLEANEFLNLTTVELPEAKSYTSETKTGQLNLPWITKKYWEIQSNIMTYQDSFILQKIQWTNNEGFSVFAKYAGDSEPVQIMLGEEQIPAKISKLKNVLAALESSPNLPTVIDLNYTDKAIIKLSETLDFNKPRN